MKSIEEVILFQIEQASKAAKIFAQRELDQQGIDVTVEQWILLKIIHEFSGLTQRELAIKSSRDPASITRTLDILERKQFISRNPVEGSRRSFSIQLTKTGQTFVDKNIEFVQGLRKKSVEGINPDELKTLTRLLGKIKENMT